MPLGWRRRRAVLVYVDLVQDIDILLPVLIGLKARELLHEIIVSRWLARASPRTPRLLRRHGLGFRWVLRRSVIAGRSPSLTRASVILTAAESRAEPHRAGHALTLRARAAGLPTFTLQHGLDQPTSNDDGLYASDHLFSWGGEATTFRKPVGRPEDSVSQVASPEFDVAVFENLHASRYSDEDRALFLHNLRLLAGAPSQPRIRIRPHPAGGWLDRHAEEFRARPNIRLETAEEARRSLAGGADAIASARRVLTTPSTIALVAARSGRPVALTQDGGDVYEPLRILRKGRDWLDFLWADPTPDLTRATRFAEGAVREGDAVAALIQHLVDAGLEWSNASMTASRGR